MDAYFLDESHIALDSPWACSRIQGSKNSFVRQNITLSIEVLQVAFAQVLGTQNAKFETFSKPIVRWSSVSRTSPFHVMNLNLNHFFRETIVQNLCLSEGFEPGKIRLKKWDFFSIEAPSEIQRFVPHSAKRVPLQSNLAVRARFLSPVMITFHRIILYLVNASLARTIKTSTDFTKSQKTAQSKMQNLQMDRYWPKSLTFWSPVIQSSLFSSKKMHLPMNLTF